jgi:thiol-disulfide isomerase/thioredoxin
LSARAARYFRLVRVAVLSGLGALGIWMATYGSFEAPANLSAPGGYALPDFRLPVLDGVLLIGDTTYLESADIQGEVALVTFWASWCVPCIREQPSLLALQDELGDRGLSVLGVLHRDSPRVALDWLARNDRLDLRSVVGTREFARGAKGGGLPQTLLVDRGGNVTEVFFGYWQNRDAYVRERVMELLGS